MLSRHAAIALIVALAACTSDPAGPTDTYDCPPEYWDCPVCQTVANDACDNEGVVTAALEGSCWREWCVDGERSLLMRADGTTCVYRGTDGLLVGGQCVNGGCK